MKLFRRDYCSRLNLPLVTRSEDPPHGLRAPINNLRRALGQRDAYPFVLTSQFAEKPGFLQQIIVVANASASIVRRANETVD